jgi:hypothetical protein
VARAQVPGYAACPSGGVDDQAGAEVAPADPDPGDPAPLRGDLADVAGPEGDPALRLGGIAQDALEGDAAAPQPEEKTPELGNRDFLGAGREQRVEDVRHLC